MLSIIINAKSFFICTYHLQFVFFLHFFEYWSSCAISWGVSCMDNFACLVIQYPSGFCVVDTTAPLQSPICVLINCDVTMNNVIRWQIILIISNVLKVICEFMLSNCPPFLYSCMNFHFQIFFLFTLLR